MDPELNCLRKANILLKLAQAAFTITKDAVVGAKYLRLAADIGSTEAQTLLGQCYSEGNGVEKNLQTAFQCYYLAAARGFAHSQHFVANCYLDGTGVAVNVPEAFKYYRLAAKQHFVPALCQLGRCYKYGGILPINLIKAERFYKLAAQHSNPPVPEAVHDAASREPDQTKAAQLYKQAAEQNFAPALYDYSQCFRFGRGGPVDLTKASHYMGLAAKDGLSLALREFGLHYAYGLVGVAVDLGKALPLLHAAAKKGDALAQFHLAKCYSRGAGVDECQVTAIHYMRLAAAQGERQAHLMLAIYYYNGAGVEQNYTTAFQHFKNSADLGMPVAQLQVAACYRNGYGVSINPALAEQYRLLALANGVTDKNPGYSVTYGFVTGLPATAPVPVAPVPVATAPVPVAPVPVATAPVATAPEWPIVCVSTLANGTPLVQCHLAECQQYVCRRPAILFTGGKCKGCKRVKYCSRQCQKADWREHKPVCTLASI